MRITLLCLDDIITAHETTLYDSQETESSEIQKYLHFLLVFILLDL